MARMARKASAMSSLRSGREVSSFVAVRASAKRERAGVALVDHVRHLRLGEPRAQHAVRHQRVVEPDLGPYVAVTGVEPGERVDHRARGFASDGPAELAAVRAEQALRVEHRAAVDDDGGERRRRQRRRRSS
jgi:hypothetical protein